MSDKQLPCPHARPDYRSCPWCMGVNDPVVEEAMSDKAEPLTDEEIAKARAEKGEGLMDCQVIAIVVKRRGKRERRFQCRRCGKTFPYELVLQLSGCGATRVPVFDDETEKRIEARREKLVQIEKDATGRVVGIRYA